MISTGQPIDPDDFLGNPAPFFSIEHTNGTTHSLTTVANQKVFVFVKANVTRGSSAIHTMTLAYDGVAKDTSVLEMSTTVDEGTFVCGYVEVPGAGTKDITVTVNNSGVISNCKIVVLKLLIG